MLSKEAVIVLQYYLEEGLSKSAIARKLGVTRRTVQRYAKTGTRASRYGPRPSRPGPLAPYVAYLRGRLSDYPELSAVRLLAELRPLGFTGGYTTVKDFVRMHRPRLPVAFETRFEVDPGEQAQVDFATFQTPFGTVYALLIVLSWSRALWVRFSVHQDELTVLGAYVGANVFPKAARILASGLVELGPMISHRVSLEELPRALDAIRQGRAVKVVVDLMAGS